MINSFKNNDQKMKYLLDIWYSETFDDAYIGKMNLDKNDVIEMSKAGRLSDYQEEAKKKQTAKISDVEITLNKEQNCLQVVFWNNTGCLDLSNFQNGIIDGSYRSDFKKDLQHFDPKNGKIVVIMPGNLIGKEWELKYLVNATNKLSDDELTNGKDIRRLFFGLKKRKQTVINDIKFALNYGAEEVYLMKGDEEFKILKTLGIDVFREIVDQINDPRIKYISQGTETKLNFIKENENGKKFYNIIKIKTDYATKSDKPSNTERPADRKFDEASDLYFYCNANYTAAIKNENVFYPSGQLTFLNAAKGKNPRMMVNDGNIFQIYAEGNHDISVVKGGQRLFDRDNELLNLIHKERKYNEARAQFLTEQITEAQKYLMTKDYNVNAMRAKLDEQNSQVNIDEYIAEECKSTPTDGIELA